MSVDAFKKVFVGGHDLSVPVVINLTSLPELKALVEKEPLQTFMKDFAEKLKASL